MGCCVSDQNETIINQSNTPVTFAYQTGDIYFCQLKTLSEQKYILSIKIVNLRTLIDVKIEKLIKHLDNILQEDFLDIIKNFDTPSLCKKLIDLEKVIMKLIEQSIGRINIFGIQFIDKAYLEKLIFEPIIDFAKNYPLLETNIKKLKNKSEVSVFFQQMMNYEKHLLFIETNIKNMTLLSVLKKLKLGLPFVLPQELKDLLINN
jgi:hypothetical protein